MKQKRTAFITGASRGIGYAIATELAAAGYSLFLVAKDCVRLAKTAKELAERHKVEVAWQATDLSRPEGIRQLIKACRRERRRFRVVVHDAGIFLEGGLRKGSAATYDKTMAIHLKAVFLLTQGLLPMLVRSQHPRIVIIGSTAGHEAYSTGAIYGVSKWAARGYAVNLRQELMHRGIGVTLLTPGGTLTDLWAGEKLPPNRLLPPADIGKLVRVAVDLAPQTVVEEIIVRPILGDIHE